MIVVETIVVVIVSMIWLVDKTDRKEEKKTIRRIFSKYMEQTRSLRPSYYREDILNIK